MTPIPYDYAIIGAGAAGLMLADAMCKDPFFADKSILLIDKDTKQHNDRTWCFWEQGKGAFDDIVYKTWHHIYFVGQTFAERFAIAPYSYKMLRAIDFYNSYLSRIRANPKVSFVQTTVNDLQENPDTVLIHTDDVTYSAKQVFSSRFDYRMVRHQQKYPVLEQHFIGWVVKTDKPVFKADTVTYMDFSIPQNGNTRFMYVLPYSEDTALVEYTLFSETLLPKQEYEQAISNYLEAVYDKVTYTIIETEQGSIPMTCYDFKEHHSARIRHIGTAGGWAKPSTGYTFMSTHKKIPKLIAFLKTGKPLHLLGYKNRFWYYDLLLLDVLKNRNDQGHHVFETLFKNRSPQLIFKFLDEQTSIWEELYYIQGSPKTWFTQALFKRIFKGF